MDQVNFEMMLPLNGYSGKFRSESTGKRGIMKFFQSCIATLKPIASLLITVPIVICYICLGAVVFLYFGSPIQWQNRSKLPQKVQVIEAFYFGRIYNSTHTGNFSQVQMEISSLIKSLTSAFISNANFFNDASTYSNGNWTFVPAALQSLCLITAIGSCVNTPPTIASQAFALCYALLGIPLSALTIANIGKYFGMFIAMLVDKMIDKWNSVRQPKLEQQESEDYTPITLNLNGNKVHRISLRLMLITFFIYLIFGALTLPEFLTNNIISSIFLCFVSLSTVAIPETLSGYAIILYLLGGLVLTTVALEVAANYLRKLHFSGRKLENCKSVKIHFGGQELSVSELIWSFGRHSKIDQSRMVEYLDSMDEFVTKTIAAKESGAFKNLKLEETYFRAKKLRIPSTEISFADASSTD